MVEEVGGDFEGPKRRWRYEALSAHSEIERRVRVVEVGVEDVGAEAAMFVEQASECTAVHLGADGQFEGVERAAVCDKGDEGGKIECVSLDLPDVCESAKASYRVHSRLTA